MIKKPEILISRSLSPYENLATEKYVTSHLSAGECVLFLWRNADTIVIGRNQNCWRECKVSEFLESGGRIARRLSGGGAVYHDVGNLNFSFIYPEGEFSTEEGLEIIARACRAHGIEAEASGRNDILTGGAKFSGNAFYSLTGEGGVKGVCHHGCILISADTGRLARFLNVSKEKLESKGVKSVRSRVVNLGSISEGLTAESFADSLAAAFREKMGGQTERYELAGDALDEIKKEAERLASDEWIFGRKLDFTDSFGARFTWGEIGFHFKVSAGVVTECRVFSDSMDPTLPSALETALAGRAFSARELEKAITIEDTTIKSDIVGLLYENI